MLFPQAVSGCVGAEAGAAVGGDGQTRGRSSVDRASADIHPVHAVCPQIVRVFGVVGESGATVSGDGNATVRGGIDRGTDRVNTLDVSVRRHLCGPGSAAVGGLGQVLLVRRRIDRGTDRIHTRHEVFPESVHRRPIGEGEAAVGGDGQAAGRGWGSIVFPM